MQTRRFEGLLVPVLTPFDSDLAPAKDAFVAHARWVLDQGADGLAPFGTTGEANSLSVDERLALLDGLLEGGISPRTIMPGTGCCALTDSVTMTRRAVERGCGGVLMLPPFYYKGMPEDGLFAAIAEVIERVGDSDLRVYLYHIPPIAQVGFSLPLIERLIRAYPETVVGLKDSSGDWANTKAIIEAFPGFDVFPGSEVFLLDGLKAGGVGAITATGNVNAAGIRKVLDAWRSGGDVEAEQAKISATRKAVQAYPLITVLKAFAASIHSDSSWLTVRPPHVAMSAADAAAALDAIRSQDLDPSMTQAAA